MGTNPNVSDSVSLAIFAVLRCLTGLSTTASLGGRTGKAGNMQLIFQRRFNLSFVRSLCRVTSNDSALIVPTSIDVFIPVVLLSTSPSLHAGHIMAIKR